MTGSPAIPEPSPPPPSPVAGREADGPQRPNPLLGLPFEPSIEGLGPDHWDVVEAAPFPMTRLRFRNNPLLRQLGIDPATVSDADLEAAYGRFEGRAPLLALRYHGYQFGVYNPLLGDGRGFLYGQLRDRHGQLQDLGTKGSGITPWSRGGDGRLTLKGGVREVIASEALQRLGVTTSRTLSLIETGEELWRGDEPSPTRSSVMVRMARTHLRFGTCERLLHLRRPAQLERLLRHVVAVHYPHLALAHPADGPGGCEPQLLAFYGELVERVARLAAEWMAAGFTHGVLNTDNMSLAGESFDYGPFAFLETWDPGFTAAYFDHSGLYAYGRQPLVCQHNLRLLQEPLAMLLPRGPLAAALERFGAVYDAHYRRRMARRLGLDGVPISAGPGAELPDPVPPTLRLLAAWPVAYGRFFAALAERIRLGGPPATAEDLEPFVAEAPAPPRAEWLVWRDAWWAWSHAVGAGPTLAAALVRWNLPEPPIRPLIEGLWTAIDERDDWTPLHNWLALTLAPEAAAGV
ncbi:YdiU family protein [Synechococcus sp. CCY 9618]|uniref:protein adenylyltransferase SelO n=1 Tax=Synechococcus sp. CCY 9618 TaxID=2815602 RepID=UPI001C213461|nr:YdiU family protein [Synechococcus sp. CCY 9618]